MKIIEFFRPATREQRLRSLAEDILAMLDAADDRALEQSAALAQAPVKPAGRPTRPAASIAEAAAHGIIKAPKFIPLEIAEKVAERQQLRAELENRDAFLCDIEEIAKLDAFKREEEARWAAASVALKRGVDPSSVCVRFALTTDEVANIVEQIGLDF